MNKRLVVFIDSVHPILEEKLQQAGFECTNHFHSSFEDLKPILSDAVGLVIRSRFTINADFLSFCPSLEFIARSGSGLENIYYTLSSDGFIEYSSSLQMDKEGEIDLFYYSSDNVGNSEKIRNKKFLKTIKFR